MSVRVLFLASLLFWGVLDDSWGDEISLLRQCGYQVGIESVGGGNANDLLGDQAVREALAMINARKEVAESLAKLERLANGGSMLARFELGSLHMLDLHGIKYDDALLPLRSDWKVAQHSLALVRGEKYVQAQILLGAIQARGAENISKNPEKARLHFETARKCIRAISAKLAQADKRSAFDTQRSLDLYFEAGMLQGVEGKFNSNSQPK